MVQGAHKKIISRLGENRNPATGLQVADNLSFVTRFIAHDRCANNFNSYGRTLVFVPIVWRNSCRLLGQRALVGSVLFKLVSVGALFGLAYL